MQINGIQKLIIETEEPKVIVSSAAASGKTMVLTERIRYLLNKGVEPSQIVAITFTNNAASVMYERLGRPQGLFIGTVHSYCNFLLKVAGIDTSKLLNDERFDDLFPLIKKHPECIRHVKHLLVDEVQDSTELQFEFFELINPDNYMYIGDVRQSIYEFAGAKPEYLLEKMNEPGVVCYRMRQNYRNSPDILHFAKKYLYRFGEALADDSISMKGSSFGLSKAVIEGDLTPTAAVNILIKQTLTKNLPWGSWFILCRSNADVDLFRDILTKEGIPNDSFKQADLTNEEINQRLKDNKVKVLTVHSAKGLENDNVLVYNVRAYNDSEARLCYVAATRAKDCLIWIKAPVKKRRKKATVNWE